jgi:hypothetical protein
MHKGSGIMPNRDGSLSEKSRVKSKGARKARKARNANLQEDAEEEGNGTGWLGCRVKAAFQDWRCQSAG